MNTNQELFETAPVSKALATMAIPTIMSQLITMIYNFADTYFIGRTNDPYKVAAASLAFMLYFMMNAVSNLFGVGGSSLISRMLGRHKHGEAKTVCAFSFYGTILITAVYSLICLVFMKPLLRFMGTSSNTYDYAANYVLWVVVIGGIPSSLSMSMAHLLRSEGYAKQAGFGLSAGGILNVVMDPLFMFVIMPDGMEVTGAALATMLSNVATMLFFISVFWKLRKKSVLSMSIRHALAGRHYLLPILSVGFPSALGSMLSTLANMSINAVLSSYGDTAIAAMGIVKKIDMLPMNIGMGLCQGMVPLVAYNCANQNFRRMKAFTDCASLWGIIMAAICILIFRTFSSDILRLFIRDEETVALGAKLLRVCCLGVPLMIYNFQKSYSFQAMGKGGRSLFLQACRQGVIFLPVLFAMNRFWGLDGIMWTQVVSDGQTVIISTILYRQLYRKMAQTKP